MSAGAIFLLFIRLGLISFGGPVAHISFFHQELIRKRQWTDDQTYFDLIALSQSLPGPVSSKIALALGIQQRGLRGGLAALLGFILPSSILFIGAAYTLYVLPDSVYASFHGLKISVVAIVAYAVFNMSTQFCTTFRHWGITVVTAIAILISNAFIIQILSLFLGGVAGKLFLLSKDKTASKSHFDKQLLSTRTALIAGGLFCFLLIVPLLFHPEAENSLLSLFTRFYQTGSAVFGGGHVVLPLLQSQVVDSGLVNKDVFLIGYGFAQAAPGPLFGFAAYLGAIIPSSLPKWLTGIWCMGSIFLPSSLLLIALLPLWEKWRHKIAIQNALAGINAAVVGLLAAMCYQSVWTSTIHTRSDLILALGAFILLSTKLAPQWVIVPLCGLTTLILHSYFSS